MPREGADRPQLTFRAAAMDTGVDHDRETPMHLHKMTHDGTAKVVSCDIHINKVTGASGLTNNSGWSWTPYDFVLDVYPDGAEPFRTEVTKHFGAVHYPEAGDKLKVRCNPEHHTVEIDVSEDARFNRKLRQPAEKRRRKAQHEQLLHEAPGTPGPDSDPDLDDDDAQVKALDDDPRVKALDERFKHGDITGDEYHTQFQKLLDGS